MSDYDFIKEFQNIKVSNICDKYKINLGNLLSGSTTEENYKKVKNEIIKELFLILSEEMQDKIVYIYLYNEMLEKLAKENKNLREMI